MKLLAVNLPTMDLLDTLIGLFLNDKESILVRLFFYIFFKTENVLDITIFFKFNASLMLGNRIFMSKIKKHRKAESK